MALTERGILHMLRQEPAPPPIVYVVSKKKIYDGSFIFKGASFRSCDRETSNRVVRKNGELIDAAGAVKPGDLIQVVAYDLTRTCSLSIESFNLLESGHALGGNMDDATELTSLEQCYAPDIVARFPLYQPRPFEGQLTPCIYDMCSEAHRCAGRKTKFKATDRHFVQFLRIKKREFDSYDYVISDGQYYVTPTSKRTHPLLLKMFDSKEIIEGTVIATNMRLDTDPIQRSTWMSVVVVQRTADFIGTPRNIQVEIKRWLQEEQGRKEEQEEDEEEDEEEEARRPLTRAQWTVPSVLSAGFVDRLDSIQWGKYSHAYGPADDTPQNILDLASTDDDEFDESAGDLVSSIFHQDTVYNATPLAFESIAALLDEPITKHARKNIWEMLHFIAERLAKDAKAIMKKNKVDSETEYRFPWEESSVVVASEATEHWLEAGFKSLKPVLSVFVRMLQQEAISNENKMYLCSVISSLMPLADRTVVSTVLGVVQSGKEDQAVTAALLYGLAAHVHDDADVRRVLEGYLSTDSYPLLCRIAVALRMAKTLKTEAPVSCVHFLDECISQRHIEIQELLVPETPSFPLWLGYSSGWDDRCIKALAALGIRGATVVTKNWKRLIRDFDGCHIMDRLNLVLRSCFIKTLGELNPDLNHLTPVQRDVLKELAALMEPSNQDTQACDDAMMAAEDIEKRTRDITRLLRNFGLPYEVNDLTSLVRRAEAWERRRTAILLFQRGANHPFVDALRAIPLNIFRHVVKYV